MLNLQNMSSARKKLYKCNVKIFENSDNSFTQFLTNIEVIQFRHLTDLKIEFNNPVTIISGTNKIGKTSILLLIACSHENFMKIDSTSPDLKFRRHIWNDVLSFTNYESSTKNYIYKLNWRVGTSLREGEGKRLATSKAWSGVGKKSSDKKRINAKIRDRELRFIDLERILPARSFSNRLLLKVSSSTQNRLHEEIEQAFSYILELPNVEIYDIGSHINKICYLVKHGTEPYSSYNAASGEESLISILKEIIESPKDSLILIDEFEIGLHPSIQRRLADIIEYISWRYKKQFIITTHSPTTMSSFPQNNRIFIEYDNNGKYHVIKSISKHAAFSKMDNKSYPIINLYCEDELSKYIIQNIALEINKDHPQFDRLINFIESGPINMVKMDYERHKNNYDQLRIKIGYCCVFDGDHKNHPDYSNYYNNSKEFTFFLYPYSAPEKFLVNSYVKVHPNQKLESALLHTDHHSLFEEMVQLGIATDLSDARNKCWYTFSSTPEFLKLSNDLKDFLIKTVHFFSSCSD